MSFDLIENLMVVEQRKENLEFQHFWGYNWKLSLLFVNL